MACGNENNEGETGATYNTLMIYESLEGFQAVFVNPTSV